jgi:hypothetical protein
LGDEKGTAGVTDAELGAMTPEQRMLDAMNKGCSRRAVAAAGDLTVAQLEERMAADAPLLRAARLGRGRAEHSLVRDLWGAKDWRAKSWLLEHWIAGGPGAEGDGLDDDERERDDLAYRRLREDLAAHPDPDAPEEARPGGVADGRGDQPGTAGETPAGDLLPGPGGDAVVAEPDGPNV